jgi:hypothetical protein
MVTTSETRAARIRCIAEQLRADAQEATGEYFRELMNRRASDLEDAAAEIEGTGPDGDPPEFMQAPKNQGKFGSNAR